MMHLHRTILVLLSIAASVLAPFEVFAQEPKQVIEIHAHRYAFSPAEITLKPGETAVLRLISDDVPHSLLVPGLKINREGYKGTSC